MLFLPDWCFLPNIYQLQGLGGWWFDIDYKPNNFQSDRALESPEAVLEIRPEKWCCCARGSNLQGSLDVQAKDRLRAKLGILCRLFWGVSSSAAGEWTGKRLDLSVPSNFVSLSIQKFQGFWYMRTCQEKKFGCKVHRTSSSPKTSSCEKMRELKGKNY